MNETTIDRTTSSCKDDAEKDFPSTSLLTYGKDGIELPNGDKTPAIS